MRQILIIFFILSFVGCATPNVMRQSCSMATQANEKTLEAKDLAEAKQHANVACENTKAIGIYLGKPDMPIKYSVEGGKLLAEQTKVRAEMEVMKREMLSAVGSMADNLQSQITGVKLTAENNKGLGIEELIAALMAYFTASKGTNLIAGKFKKKKSTGKENLQVEDV